MEFKFPVSTPEAQGVPSCALLRFQTHLDAHRVPLHSVLMMRGGHLILEAYTPPFTKSTPHRLYSVTKSFVSLAIGLLQEEGKLTLDDRVADYFADKLAGRDLHPYIRQTTIRDLLRMASPHIGSAYKLLSPVGWSALDWVESFFTCPPSHLPGRCFAYDTSATHVLCALAERLCGQELLAYLREKCLDEIGFSHQAFCLKDACGVSMGGSGLMATPYDLLRVLRLLQLRGEWDGKQLLPRDYVDAATSKQIDNFAKPAGTPFEEIHGYGYQFWRIREGFACYGMGGQLAICLPQSDMLLVTTADTQDIPGGVQLLYDAFFNEVYPHIQDHPLPEDAAAYGALMRYSQNRSLPCVPGADTSSLADHINGVRYALDDNPMGFSALTLTLNGPSGALSWEKENGAYALPFSMGAQQITHFPEEGYLCAVSGAFRSESCFVVRAQLLDTCVGSITFELAFDGPDVTLLMHKVEETQFRDYSGFVSGRREP